MYGYNAGQPMAIPIYTVLPYCVINIIEDDACEILQEERPLWFRNWQSRNQVPMKRDNQES